MPQQYSTSDLLEAILDELSVINERLENPSNDKDSEPKEVTFKLEGNEEVVALLTGMAALDPDKGKKMEDIAKNAEYLCNSMKALAEIDLKAVQTSVVQVANMVNVLSALKIEDKHVTNIKTAVDTFGKLNERIKHLAESLQDLQFDKKKLKGLKELLSIVEALNKINTKDGGIGKLSKVFTIGAALKIRFFLSQISKANKSGHVKDTAEAVAILLAITGNIAKNRKAMKRVKETLEMLEELDPDKAHHFGKYIKNLINPIKKLKVDQLKQVVEIIKMFNKTLMTIVGSIAILTIIAMIDTKSLLVGTSVLIGTMWALSTFLIKLTKYEKELPNAAYAVHIIANAVQEIAAAIGLMSLLVMFVDLGTIALGTGIVLGVMYAVTAMAIKLAKQQDEIKNGKTAISKVADALLKVTVAIGIMALMLKVFDMKEVLIGTGITLAVMLALVGMTMLLAKGKDGEMDKAVGSMQKLCYALLMVTAAIGIMALIVKMDLKGALVGSLIVSAVMLIMVGIVRLLGKMEDKELRHTMSAMTTLTAILLAVSLMSLFIFIPISQKAKDVMLGGVIVMAIMGIMMLMVYGFSKMDKTDLMMSAYSMAILTVVFLVIALIANTILPEIAAQWKEAAIGGAVVAGIMILMTAMVWALSEMKKEALLYSVGAMAIMTFLLLAVSLITKELLIPIGDQWADAAKGGAVVMSVLAIMTGLVWGLSKVDSKHLLYGVGALAIMTVLVWIVSEIVENYFIPFGQNWEDALRGGSLVIGTITILTGIVVGLSHLMKKVTVKDLVKAEAVLFSIAALLWVITKVMVPYSALAKDIGRNWDVYSTGSLLIAAVIAGWGLLALGAGKLAENEQIKSALIKGSIVILGLAGLLFVLGMLMPTYLDLAKQVHENIESVTYGSLELAGLLLGWGLLIGGIGALIEAFPMILAWLALGAVVITALSGVLFAMGLMLPSYIKLAINVSQNAADIAKGSAEIALLITAWGVMFGVIGALVMNPIVLMCIGVGAVTLLAISGVMVVLGTAVSAFMDMLTVLTNGHDVKAGAEKVQTAVTEMAGIIKAIGKMVLNPFTAVAIGAGGTALVGIALAIKALKSALLDYFQLIEEMKQFSVEDMLNFRNFVIGDKDSFVDVVTTIIDKLSDIGVIATAKAVVISQLIRPIFLTIKDFMNVVKAFGEMKYVTEWDKDGKPIKYESMTPDLFMRAANSISTSFTLFLTQLGKSMESWDFRKAFVLMLLKDSLGPVMQSIGTFVDGIMKMATGSIPTEWNAEGTAIKFRTVTPADFSGAAVAVSQGFTSFLTALGPAMESLGPLGVWCIKSLSNGIEPVMTAVGTFANTIMEVLVGKTFDVPDPKNPSKTIKKHIDFNADSFKEAAMVISTVFTSFLTTLYDNLKEYDMTGMEIAGQMLTNLFRKEEDKKNVNTNKIGKLFESLQGITVIVDACQKLCELVVQVSKDMEKIDMKKVAIDIAGIFVNFVDTLASKIGNEKMTEQLEMVKKSLEANIMSILNSFSKAMDSLKKVYENIQGSYLDYANMYKTMIGALITSEMLSLYKQADKVMDDQILPLMVKYAQLMEFFSKLELKTDALSISLNAKKMEQNAKKMVCIITDFTDALAKYKQAVVDVDMGIFNHIGTEIGKMYDTVNQDNLKFYNSFAKICNLFAQAYEKSFRRTSTKLVNSLTSIHTIAQKLDNLIINQRKKRNEALKDLKTHIDNIATATDNLANALKTVSANSDALADAQSKLNAARKANAEVAAQQQQSAPGQDAKSSTADTGKKAVAAATKNINDAASKIKDPAIRDLIISAAQVIAASVAQEILTTFQNREINVHGERGMLLNGKVTV